jgi:DNA repair exonuclease SbcCD ATPase subunit
LEDEGEFLDLEEECRMDAKQARLQKRLEDLLREASTVAAELQGIEQGSGTPHYDQIELPAHALGQRLSRMIQGERSREVAAAGLADAACPKCGRKCRVQTKKREVHSMDGPLELLETVAQCRPCRRSFFPSAGRTGT